MLTEEPFDLLRKCHFLQDVNDEDLLALVATLEHKQYESGEVIIRQGAKAGGMYFIEEGSVEIVLKRPDRHEQILAALEAGDTFGELEMVFTQPRIASVRAKGRVSAYRLNREALTNFMKTHPLALANLKFSAQSRRLSYRLRFPWLAEDEVVYGLARKHTVLLYQALTLPLLLLAIAAVVIIFGLFGNSTLSLWVGAGLCIPAIALALWRWVDWGNDYYLVTNRRAVWLEKVVGIYDSRSEAPLHTVLSVSVTTDMLGRSLGYGDVIIRTYTGQLVFRSIGTPHAMAAMIEEHWQRARDMREKVDRDELREAVRQRLDPEEDQDTPQKIRPLPDAEGIETDTTQNRMGFFHVRYEDGDRITYRKHWAVLMREIGPPSMLLLLMAGLIGARIAGLIVIAEIATFLLITVFSLIPLFMWWLYRYIDWTNDIYQVTPDQIVDVSRKPLARELRKVAPLENILGTEVDRKGIFGILLNFGDVIANVGTEQFVFEGVYDPVGVQQDIVRAQDAFMQLKQDKERRQRRDEVVELLDIYHDEYASRDAQNLDEDE
jgi:CRP-like cAMP-binding protein